MSDKKAYAPMRSTRFFLEHIHDHAQYLTEASEGLTKERFLEDRTLILAFERSLAIIGEAVANIDDDFKAAHPDIPWHKIRGLRNVVAHVYWQVDYDIIWHVVTTEVPVFKRQVETLLAAS